MGNNWDLDMNLDLVITFVSRGRNNGQCSGVHGGGCGKPMRTVPGTCCTTALLYPGRTGRILICGQRAWAGEGKARYPVRSASAGRLRWENQPSRPVPWYLQRLGRLKGR